MDGLISSETSVLVRATRHNIPEDTILHTLSCFSTCHPLPRNKDDPEEGIRTVRQREVDYATVSWTGPLGGQHRAGGGNYHFHHQGGAVDPIKKRGTLAVLFASCFLMLLVDPEDGNDIFLRNWLEPRG
jgi:hypothetical protein